MCASYKGLNSPSIRPVWLPLDRWSLTLQHQFNLGLHCSHSIERSKSYSIERLCCTPPCRMHLASWTCTKICSHKFFCGSPPTFLLQQSPPKDQLLCNTHNRERDIEFWRFGKCQHPSGQRLFHHDGEKLLQDCSLHSHSHPTPYKKPTHTLFLFFLEEPTHT